MPIPNPVAAAETGLPDSQWVADVRDALEDYVKPINEVWTADGTNGPLSVSAQPVPVTYPKINGSAATNVPLIRDNTTSTNYTVIDSGVPTSTQVLVNYDTGLLQFGAAPAQGDQILIQYQSVKWRDTSITTALYAGLRQMFPRVGKSYADISIPIQVNVWDYTLPTWCADPRSRLLTIEISDPAIPTEPYKPAPPGIRRIGLTTLHLPWSQAYSPTARLRVSGWGPYLTLGDLEPQLYHLPVWYALSVLLGKRESKRVRQDTLVPLTKDGGQQPGLQLQTGDYYRRLFDAELNAMARTPGPAPALPMATVYQAGFKRGRRY